MDSAKQISDIKNQAGNTPGEQYHHLFSLAGLMKFMPSLILGEASNIFIFIIWKGFSSKTMAGIYDGSLNLSMKGVWRSRNSLMLYGTILSGLAKKTVPVQFKDKYQTDTNTCVGL